MAKKSEPLPQLTTWDVDKIAKRVVWLGTVEAPDKSAAVERPLRISKLIRQLVRDAAAMTPAMDFDQGRKAGINGFDQKVALPTDNP